MKRYCKDLVLDYEFVWKAFDNWAGSQSGKKNLWRVYKMYGTPKRLCRIVLEELETNQYVRSSFRMHYEKETNGKLRYIAQLNVKDQLYDYIVITALDDFFSDKIGATQVASTKGKGPLYGAKLASRYCKDSQYYIHADIKKCYESIDQVRLYTHICRYIANETITMLLYTIILAYLDNPLRLNYQAGLPIGSALSLKLAQWVISCGYHEIEPMATYRRGKRIRSFNHQLWYADDLYLFGNSKKQLRRVMEHLDGYFQTNFRIHFKSWKIAQVYSEPVDIAGYVVHHEALTLRGKTYLRIRRATNRFMQNASVLTARTICSYHGQLLHINSIKARRNNAFDISFLRARTIVSDHSRRANNYGGTCYDELCYAT